MTLPLLPEDSVSTPSGTDPGDPDRIRRIDPLCDEFERSFRDGGTPEITAFLDRVSAADRTALLKELVALDWQWRRGRGEDVALDEYRMRFPELTLETLEYVAGLSVIQQSPPPRSGAGSTDPPPGIVLRVSPTLPVEVADPDATRPLLPGSSQRSTRKTENPRIGDYEILEEIARGGMGVVYKARQLRVNRIVALKMMLSGQFAGPMEIERFRAEAQAAGQFDHPNIVPIYEVGEYAGQPFFSMGYVDGQSLKAVLADGPLPPRHAAELIRSVCDAVQYAHDRNIIHRDLKPANILLDSQQRPRVTDFGLAKRIAADTGMTMTGQALGTPSFMPPEQAMGDAAKAGPAADVYSLGATLYNLITGRPPFQSSGLTETLRQVMHEEPISPRVLNRAIPADLETVCLKAMQKQPEKRYASAGEFGADLGRFLNNEPIHARPVGRIERAWRWCARNRTKAALYAVSVVSAFVLLVSGVFASSQMKIAAARKENADVEKLFGLLRKIDEHQARGRVGWTQASEADVREAIQLPPAQKHLAALRSGVANAAGAIDVRHVRTLAEGFPADSVFYHPNGRWLSLGRRRAPGHVLPVEIRVVDVTTGDTVRSLTASVSTSDLIAKVSSFLKTQELQQADGIECHTISPDGRWLVAGTRTGRLYRWDLDVPDAQATAIEFPEGENAIGSVAFRKDGGALVACRDKHVRLWSVPEWEESGHNHMRGPAGSLSCGIPGSWIACSAGDEFCLLSDDMLDYVRAPVPYRADCLAVAPDGRTLFFVENGRGLFVLPFEDPTEPVGRLRALDSDQAHISRTTQSLFSADGQLLLTCAESDGHVRLWETISGRLLAHVVIPGTILKIAFAPNGRSFAVARDDTTELYEIRGLHEQSQSALLPQPLTAFAFDERGDWLFTKCRAAGVVSDIHRDGQALCCWPIIAGAPSTAPSHVLSVPKFVDAISSDPAGRLAFASDGRVQFWIPSRPEVEPFEIDVRNGFKGLGFVFNSDRLWIAGSKDLRAFDGTRTEPVARVDADLGERLSGLGNVTSLAVGVPYFAVGWRGGALRVHKVKDGEQVLYSHLSRESELSSVAVSPGGGRSGRKLVAAGSMTGELFVLPIEGDGAAMPHNSPEEPHLDTVTSLAFLSEDVLASGSADRTVKFWRVDGDRVRLLFALNHPRRVRSLAFDPDQQRLAVLIEGERGLRFWHLGRLMARFREFSLAADLGDLLPEPMPEETPSNDPPSQITGPVRDVAKSAQGLRGQFFADSWFQRPVLIRYDQTTEFNWGEAPPDARMPGGAFTVRWTGWLRPPGAGTYHFSLKSEGDATVWLDGRKCLRAIADATDGYQASLADRPCSVRIDFRKSRPNASLRFAWQTPGAPAEQPIPLEYLFLSDAKAAEARVNGGDGH